MRKGGIKGLSVGKAVIGGKSSGELKDGRAPSQERLPISQSSRQPAQQPEGRDAAPAEK